MNEQFSSILTARLAELTGSLRFEHKPSGVARAPQIVETMLPPKSHDHQEGQEFPLVRWAIHNGGFDFMRPAPFGIILHAGIYTSGDIIAGTRDITTLALALGRIANDRSFPPYRLETPVPFTIGSPEQGSEGLQPHPYYWLTMKLQFIVPSGHGG
ncbi:MAG: hypothetical protein VR65_10820 [Desulfobulbaceae bacterium BRH_c16a]|nr:MAG: hypothetical protein VR65_10820 [Desulfobulbaceae bacterium BRH_c16a]